MLDHVCNQLITQRIQTLARIQAVPEAWMFLQPGGLVNHPAWELGHLHCSDQIVAKVLGNRDVDQTVLQNFGQGSTPTQDTGVWTRVFGTRDRAIDRVRTLHAEVVGMMRALTPQRLEEAPSVERARAAFPKIGDMVAYMLWHEGYHAGQVSQWRRAVGMIGGHGEMPL